MGITEERYLFLEKCILKDGMSRKAAIKALMRSKCGKKRDGKPIKESTAETMAYQRFSGEKFVVKPKKKKVAPTKKAPVKKVATKTKPPVKKAVARKPAAKQPIAKKPAAKRPVAKKATKPAPKKAPTEKEKSFKEKALDEVQQSTKTAPRTSKKQAPIVKKTATPKSGKRGMIKEGSELQF